MAAKTFAPFQVRVPQEYLIGEESPGLAAFRRMLPPFIHVEVVSAGAPDEENMIATSVMFDVGENFASHFLEFAQRTMDVRMGRSTKEFTPLSVVDAIEGDPEGKKLGIPLIKEMIVEIVRESEPEYVDGATKVYVIHPPALEGELSGHLAVLPVPAMADSALERVMGVRVDKTVQSFVVQPYKMDLIGRHSEDPRWLIIHLYNPNMPALVVKVGEHGPWSFKEPTPLLSDTKDAESWAVWELQTYLRGEGVDIEIHSEPNGPTTFPDFRTVVGDEIWDVEVTRVLGDLLNSRHVPEKSRDSKKVIERAAQSSQISDTDVEKALDHAIRSKARKRPSVGTGFKYGLLLMNPVGLDVGKHSPVWQGKNLSSFDAVVLISGYTHPKIEFIKGSL